MLDLAGKTRQQSRYGCVVMLVVEGSWGRGGWEKVKLLGAGGTFEFRDREPEALAKVRHSASRGSLSTRFDLGQRVKILCDYCIYFTDFRTFDSLLTGFSCSILHCRPHDSSRPTPCLVGRFLK